MVVPTAVQTAIGIDIGGTKISSALVHPEEGLKGFCHEATPTESEPFLETLSVMAKRLRDEQAGQGHLVGIGIATAGIVDPYRGAILGATGNLPAVNGIADRLKSLLEERIGLPVYIENDANAAAYGECRAGAGIGKKDVLMVTLGTGVGTGIIIDGKMLHGAHFTAGEGGHIFIAQNEDRKCTCGRWNCWEAYASGTGFRATARQMAHEHPEAAKSLLAMTGGEAETLTSHQVIAAWREGNPLAQKIVDVWHNHVALGIGGLVNVLDPEIVVVGGGMEQFVDYDKLRALVGRYAMPPVNLVAATLGNQAGILGAGYLALEHFGQACS